MLTVHIRYQLLLILMLFTATLKTYYELLGTSMVTENTKIHFLVFDYTHQRKTIKIFHNYKPEHISFRRYTDRMLYIYIYKNKTSNLQNKHNIALRFKLINTCINSMYVELYWEICRFFNRLLLILFLLYRIIAKFVIYSSLSDSARDAFFSQSFNE